MVGINYRVFIGLIGEEFVGCALEEFANTAEILHFDMGPFIMENAEGDIGREAIIYEEVEGLIDSAELKYAVAVEV